jgi:GYF domain 2
MSDGKKHAYLGKQGQIFGPFDSEEMENLYASGEINHYTYLWDASISVWKPIEEPPSDPSESKGAGNDPARPFEVVCHDSFFSLVSGILRKVTDRGCELISGDPSDAPPFGLAASLTLNVLDPSTRRSINMKVQVRDIFRRNGDWVYLLRWNTRPSFQ